MIDPDRLAHDRPDGPDEPPPSPRAFALVLAGFSLVLAYALRRRGVTAPALYAPPACGALLLVASVLAPGPVTVLARGWALVGKALGKVTTPVLLTLVFALVLVPLRGLLIVLRRDPLTRRFDRDAKSYWEPRARRAFTRDDFERLS